MSFDSERGRALFPRGLYQPAGSYRFGADALLLAAFGASTRQQNEANAHPATPGTPFFDEAGSHQTATAPFRCVDLGTGCGAAGLGLALLCADVFCVGVEKEAELAEAAARNARALGLSHRFDVIVGDVAAPHTMLTRHHQPHSPSDLLSQNFSQHHPRFHHFSAHQHSLVQPGSFALVLSNPPWRVEGTGRMPAGVLRRSALFGPANTLGLFAKTAALLLAPGGRYCTAIGAFREHNFLDALHRAGLSSHRVIQVRSLPGHDPWLVLIEAVKARDEVCQPAEVCESGEFRGHGEVCEAGEVHETGTACDAPQRAELTLCEQPGVMTAQAAAFCPFLWKDSG